jgi:hypothetical protein
VMMEAEPVSEMLCVFKEKWSNGKNPNTHVTPLSELYEW